MGQITRDGAQWFLGFLLLVGLGLWAVEHFGGLQHSAQRRIGVRVGVILALVLSGTQMIDFTKPVKEEKRPTLASQPVVKDGKINWADFSPFRVGLEHKRQRPVFMDYTADWCLNCKTNEKAFIETEAVRKALVEMDILPMVADWTNEDEEITKWLEKLGRTGIPAYVVYYPNGEYDLLPEVITEKMILDLLTRANTKYPLANYRSMEEACAAN